MLQVDRFAENLAVALRHRVATENPSGLKPGGNVGRLLIGESGDQIRGAFAAAYSAFGGGGGRTDFETIARLGQQLSRRGERLAKIRRGRDLDMRRDLAE